MQWIQVTYKNVLVSYMCVCFSRNVIKSTLKRERPVVWHHLPVWAKRVKLYSIFSRQLFLKSMALRVMRNMKKRSSRKARQQLYLTRRDLSCYICFYSKNVWRHNQRKSFRILPPKFTKGIIRYHYLFRDSQLALYTPPSKTGIKVYESL